MIDGFTKVDPPTKKMLPVEANVPELMVKIGYGKEGSIKAQAVGDLAVIAFYYLLRIGEYTVKIKKQIQTDGSVHAWGCLIFQREQADRA